MIDFVPIVISQVLPYAVPLQALATLILAFYTWRSVQNGEGLMEANRKLAEANQDMVEETRKERKRESVKNLLIDISNLKEKLDRHSYRINNLRRGLSSSYKELPEWDIDLSSFPLDDIRRIEKEIDETDVVKSIRDYKSLYQRYSRQRESAYKYIKRNLTDSRVIEDRINEIDWPYKEHISSRRSKYRDPRRKRSRDKTDTSVRYLEDELTEDEAREYIRNNKEKLAIRILEDHRLPASNLRYRIIYNDILEEYKENDRKVKEELDELDEVAEKLRNKYTHIMGDYKTRSIRSEINKLIDGIMKEYDILESDIEEANQETTEDRSLSADDLDGLQISEVDFEIGSGTVYLKSENFNKDRDDINREDYETDSEYYRVRQEETPGQTYDSIFILKDGWVQCINEFSDEERGRRIAETYPPHEIEKIRYTVSNKSGGEWNDYRFDGKYRT